MNREKIRKLEEELQEQKTTNERLKDEAAKKEEEYMAEKTWESKMVEDDDFMDSQLGENVGKAKDAKEGDAT